VTTELALIAKATVILGIALAATHVARHARASMRASFLAAAFGLVMVMPIASALTPVREVPIPVAIAPAFLANELAAQPEVLGVQPRPTEPKESSWQLPSLRTLTRSAWLLGAVITALPLALGLWRVRRIRRRGQAWPPADAFVEELRAPLGLRRSVTIVLQKDVVAPATCGWMRPTIMLPIDAPDWSAEDLRQALLHELEHVRRHDWPVHVIARLTCSLYWFHPAAWIAWRQLSLESERACDDAVVVQAENTAYAQQLVALARRVATVRAQPLLSMADRRTLATRVASILSTNVARGRVSSTTMTAIVVCAAALSAALFPLQARARVQSSPGVASATVEPGLRFGVASVRPNDGTDPSRGFGFTLESGRLRLRNQTLQTITSIAYAPTFGLWFPDERISGGPPWINTDRFTIDARAERAVTGPEMGAMLRSLLVDRFGLKVRVEPRTAAVYALVVIKRDRSLGPSLKPTAIACTGRCGIGGGSGRYQLSGASMALLAGSLSELVGRPVVDRTGLTGTFDGTLEWSPTPEELGALGEPAPAAAVFGASLFTALEEQFGLKLQSERGPVEYLVIESAEQPTPNDAPELAAQASQPAQSAPQPPRPTFEVASIRLNTAPTGAEDSNLQPSGRVSVTYTTLYDLVSIAFGRRQRHEVAAGERLPSWVVKDRWDIVAQGPPIASTTPAIVRVGQPNDADEASGQRLVAMMRNLLIDRFKLVTRRETRNLPAYALVMASNDKRLGPQMQTSSADCAALSSAFVATGARLLPNSPVCGLRMFERGRLYGTGVMLTDFARGLTSVAGRTVVDATGLTGAFDLDLRWSADRAGLQTPDGVSVFTAIQEQLGLELQARTVPIDVLVIESAERPTN